MNFPHIFEPITVRGMRVKNRVVMMPMGSNMAMPDGGMSDSHLNYYRLRAKGGTGLILVENVAVTYPAGSNGTTQLRLDQDCYIPKFYQLTEAVHAFGGCIGVQINHAGASAKAARIGMQPVSASDLPSRAGGEIPRPLTVEEIYQIVKDYAAAAGRAKAAGFDCVEIHGGHSYLLSQFLSPTMNDRTDEFGGSAENRCRIVKLIAQAIRKEVGEQFPILIRVSADEFLPSGNTLDDTLDYLKYFIDDVDVIDVSAALNDSGDRQIDLCYHPDGWRSYMARAVKEKYGKPVITMGNIRDPQVAEDILARGDADFIGMGRGLIADPAWANKAEEGRCDDIRKCISCNIGCAGHRIGLNRPLRCTLNPSLCAEEDHAKHPVKKPCNVVVIGGGTAGLEAACTAAEVGCQVTLLEKSAQLGGLAREISLLPEKKRIMDAVDYFTARAKKLPNLNILTETEATVSLVAAFSPDLIINATGSKPFVPPVKGAERVGTDGKVEDILGLIHDLDRFGGAEGDHTGKKVAVIGGGAVGLDVMEYFALRGAEVTVVEMFDAFGKDLDPISRTGVNTLIREKGVKLMPRTKLCEISDGAFELENSDGAFSLAFDYGFVCAGMRAYSPIQAELEAAFAGKAKVLNIGDSVRARRIIDGVAEGRNVLLTLDAMGHL